MAPQERPARYAFGIVIGLVLLAGIIILMAQRQRQAADNTPRKTSMTPSSDSRTHTA